MYIIGQNNSFEFVLEIASLYYCFVPYCTTTDQRVMDAWLTALLEVHVNNANDNSERQNKNIWYPFLIFGSPPS